MKSWEQRADTFHFKHRTKNNNDKVSLLTSHAFKFNKPIELEDEWDVCADVCADACADVFLFTTRQVEVH